MKRYILCAAVCLILCGCDESTSTENTCDTAIFQPTCLSDVSYLACVNGNAVKGLCGTGMHCIQGSCVAGCTQRCDGNVLVSCSNGNETRTDCPNGCENNACIIAPKTCKPDGARCEGNVLVTCAAGVESRNTCPNGCENNACKTAPAACTPDGARCEGNVLVTCAAGVESRNTCPNGCENNACKTAPAACSPDGSKCEGNVLVTCAAGIESRETCPNGCENNACKEPQNSCGNGVREGSELCDGEDLGKLTCQDVKGNTASTKYVGKPKCSEDCKSLLKGTCRIAPQSQGGIEKCQFVDLEQNDTTEEVTGHALLIPIDGVTNTMIKGRLACGNPSVATYSWKYEAARFMECDQCAENEYKLVSEVSYAEKAAGTYGCVFQIYVNTKDIDGSNSTSYYNCPVEMGYPFAQDIPTDEIMRTFDVKAEPVEGAVLAHWDFANYKKDDRTKSAQANDGIFASSSFISLSDGSEIRMLSGTGDYPEGAASGDKWSTESSLTDLDNTKHFVLTSQSTGYKNVRFQFKVAGSGINEKHVIAAYRINNTPHLVGNELNFSDSNKFHEYPLTTVNELSNQKELELDVYTYGSTDPNMTIRLDDIYLLGDTE